MFFSPPPRRICISAKNCRREMIETVLERSNRLLSDFKIFGPVEYSTPPEYSTNIDFFLRILPYGAVWVGKILVSKTLKMGSKICSKAQNTS